MQNKKLALPPSTRKPRADGQRNRERMLEVEKEVFTCDGATASLDGIANQAAFASARSTATFPPAMPSSKPYRSEVEKLAAAEQRFAAKPVTARSPPRLDAACHRPCLGKKLIISAMDTVADGSMRLIEGARSLIHTVFVAAVKRAIASGDLRSNTDPYDFVRALIGVFHTTAISLMRSRFHRL
jgi:hypothetical protein